MVVEESVSHQAASDLEELLVVWSVSSVVWFVSSSSLKVLGAQSAWFLDWLAQRMVVPASFLGQFYMDVRALAGQDLVLVEEVPWVERQLWISAAGTPAPAF